MEVFAEKMLVACQALLGVVAELKRNALLNDVAGRNAEVRAGGCSMLCAVLSSAANPVRVPWDERSWRAAVQAAELALGR